jgi:hypothetical protein
MQTQNVSIVFAGVLILSLSLPAAAEKLTGVNKDYQTISETSATVPDKPGHVVKQLTTIFKTLSPNLGESWVNQVGQEDNVGPDGTHRGYGTNHYPNGDMIYYSYEGAGKTTTKDGGDFEVVAQGKFSWLGGTGKYKNIKGSGTYTCKFTPKGGGCDWQGEADM